MLPKSSRNSSAIAEPLAEISIRPIVFEVVPFDIDTAIPAGFPQSEALLEGILRKRLHHVLVCGLDLFSAIITLPLELQFHLRE